MSESAPVYLSLPTYDGTGNIAGILQGVGQGTTRRMTYRTTPAPLLAFNFNFAWCEALNGRKTHGHEWFAMLHADIIPDRLWIDTLIEEAEEHDADLVSAVVPIKGGHGSTSTALDDTDESWNPLLRLTQAQVNHPDFPKTFDIDSCIKALAGLPEELRVEAWSATRLLVNTGCFVARLNGSWAEQVCFTVRDRIRQKVSGSFYQETIPEDWGFSCDVARLGGKVMASTKVRLNHRGPADFLSDKVWGEGVDLVRLKPKGEAVGV